MRWSVAVVLLLCLRRRWRWPRKAGCRRTFAARANAWRMRATFHSFKSCPEVVPTRCSPIIRCTLRPAACLRKTDSAWESRSSRQEHTELAHELGRGCRGLRPADRGAQADT